MCNITAYESKTEGESCHKDVQKATSREKMCMSGSLPKAEYIENKEPDKFVEATGSVITKNLGLSQRQLSEIRNYLHFQQQNSPRFSIERDLRRTENLAYLQGLVNLF